MATVTNLRSVGCAYRNGFRMPGWGTIFLDNGDTIYVPESENSFSQMLAHAEALGHNCRAMRTRIAGWVKTGEAWQEANPFPKHLFTEPLE